MKRYIGFVVAAITVASVALAIMWAVRLPVFLAPDEDSHYDYALTLFTAGRPMRPAENVVGRDTHPVVAYLMTATHARQQRLDSYRGADAGYGSESYMRALQVRAPNVDAQSYRRGPIDPVPYISRLYPIGYYALAALAIALGDRLTHDSIFGQFFFARFLSVALLVPTLVFTWLALRETGIGPKKSLVVFACVALLPMTAWMAGSIQPDNLVCALVAAAAYTALRLRRDSNNWGQLFALGMLFGALIATKAHYFLAIFLPVVAMLCARLPLKSDPIRAGTRFLPVLLPPLLAYAITEPMLRAAPGGHGVCQLPGGLGLALQRGLPSTLHFFAAGFANAFAGSFLLTQSFKSFWFAYTAYRTTLIDLGSPVATELLLGSLPVLSCAIALLFVVRILAVWRRLVEVGRRRSFRSAARVATSNILINGYLCLFLILFGYETYIGGAFPMQGRYWLPFLAGIWICTFFVAPKVLPRRWQSATSKVTVLFVLAFVTLTSARSYASIEQRFYEPQPFVAPAKELAVGVRSRVHDGTVSVAGVAIDLRRAQPVERVVLRFDDRFSVAAREVDRPDVLCAMEQALLATGFAATVKTNRLGAGRHVVEVFVKTPWTRTLVDTGERAFFDT